MKIIMAIAEALTNIIRAITNTWGAWAGLGIMAFIYYAVAHKR